MILKELARLTIRKIKSNQNCFTSSPESIALYTFEDVVDNHESTDVDLINAAIQAKNLIGVPTSYFCNASQESQFILEINFFIEQAKQFLKDSDESVMRQNAIRNLALLTILDIRNKQHPGTNFSRIRAIEAFEKVVFWPDSSDEQIIASAKRQKHRVLHHGVFGFWGKAGSYFLQRMNRFLETAEIFRQPLVETPKDNVTITFFKPYRRENPVQPPVIQNAVSFVKKYIPSL